MRKFLKPVLLCLLCILLLSCERDEICLEDITPKLIIRFHNANIPDEVKSVLNLIVEIEGIDGEYTNETIKVLTDSISIPLVVTENNTRFILTIPGDDSAGTEDNIDTISLVYTQQDIFISRSCGYKTIFNDVEGALVTDDDNWIKAIEAQVDPLEIIDENSAHVKIYH